MRTLRKTGLLRLFSGSNRKYHKVVHSMQTPLGKAAKIIHKRRGDSELIKSVEEYLQGDIPPHFNQDKPIFYLSRHIPTPNEETLRFMQMCRAFNPEIPVVIGQDTDDIFVGNNILKHNLGKLRILEGYSKKHEPIYSNKTIIDFSSAQGSKLSSVETICDISLVDFHTDMLNRLSPGKVTIADESGWVSRNNRGDLLEHYKHVLALLVVHGIMFEFYEDEDEEFVYETLIPAFNFIEDKFGCKPLITFLVDPAEENEKDWNAYPSSVQPYIEHCLKQANLN